MCQPIWHLGHTSNNVFVSLNATFLEKEFLGEGTVASKVELDEVQQIEGPTSIAESESDLIRLDLKPNVPAPLKRSGRVPHQPDRYYSFLVWDGDPIELDENNEDLITYMDALQRSDSEAWLRAMRFEMESMEINNV